MLPRILSRWLVILGYVFANAPHVINGTSFSIERGAAMPMECRGVPPRWDAHEGMLSCWI